MDEGIRTGVKMVSGDAPMLHQAILNCLQGGGGEINY